jgi:hypothetical protein
MSELEGRQSMLVGGLRMVLRNPGAVVWTYVFNLGIALVFSLSYHARVSNILDHSMASERLNAAFDLGTLGALVHKLSYREPTSGAGGYLGLPVYFLVYFVLVPGTLFAYRLGAPQRLAILVSSGLCFFWRFVRIALLTALVSALVLGPLLALQNAWIDHVDEHVVGFAAVEHDLPGWIVILLIAALLRVFFDLVEVYTTQLDDQYLENGKPDRRVRKVLLPAAKLLWSNFGRIYGVFWLTTLLGLAALALSGTLAVEMLAEPRVWPAFLLLQVGFFASIFTRYWMRAAETVLVAEFMLPGAVPVEGLTEVMQPSCGSFVYGHDRPLAFVQSAAADALPEAEEPVNPEADSLS